MTTRIADAHSDLICELVAHRAEANPFASRWLPPLRAGGVQLQICAVHVEIEHLPESALRRALLQVGALHRAVRENEGVSFVASAGDVAAIDDRGIGLMLSLEGAEALGYEIELAEIMWQLGIRAFGLTWNRRNPFADGCAEERDGGLSRFGAQLVEELARLGAIIDLAHASKRTFWDVLERTGDSPVFVSHAGCAAVHPTPRNLDDDQLAALAHRNGILAAMAHPITVDPGRPTIDRLIDHIEHAISIMGGDRVALGGDFVRQILGAVAIQAPPDALLPSGVGLDAALDELAGPEDYPNLTAALERRGFGAAIRECVLSTNLEAFLSRSLPGADAALVSR